MKSKITLLLCLFSISFVYSQYDWTNADLVLKNGDTLSGEVELPIISKNYINFNGKEKVKFRKEKGSKKTKYDDSQVDKIIFNQPDSKIAVFEYVQTSKKNKGLFEIIKKGKATLYGKKVNVTSSSPGHTIGPNGGMTATSFNTFTNSHNEFYVLKENESIASPLITIRISRSFRKRAMEYFADCPSLVKKLEEKIYKKDDVITVVEEYNQCH